MSKNSTFISKSVTDEKYTFREVPLVHYVEEIQIDFNKQRRRHNIANFVDYILKKFGL